MWTVFLLVFFFLRLEHFTSYVRPSPLSFNTGENFLTKNVEYPNDNLATQRNTKCIKLTYPSLTIFRSHMDPNFSFEASVGKGEFETTSKVLSLVTVKVNGSPNFVTDSNTFNAFASFQGDADSSMYVCVRQEPLKGFSEVEFEPNISVQWANFLSYSSSHIIVATFEKVDDANSIFAAFISFTASADSPVATLLLNAVLEDTFELSNGGAIWINYYKHTLSSAVHHVQVCWYLENSKDAVFVTENISLIFVISSFSAHNAPEEKFYTHLTENGNMKLKTSRSSTPDWALLCTDYSFSRNYQNIPFVFISVSFRGKTSPGVYEPAVTGWVEFVNEAGFRACLGRPHYAGEARKYSFSPYLEFLAISQDGIFDVEKDDGHSKHIFLTFELTPPVDFAFETFLKLYVEDADFINCLFSEFVSDSSFNDFFNYGYMINPQKSSKLYLFLSYAGQDEAATSYAISEFEEHFSDGYFPYLRNLSHGCAYDLMDALYPRRPETEEEKIKVSFWADWGCPVGPFNISGPCSVAECDDKSSGGMKTISRERLLNSSSDFCPPLTREIPCNLPPCTFEDKTFLVKSKKLLVSSIDSKKAGNSTKPDSEVDPESHSGDRYSAWLWVLISVFGFVVVGVSAYCIYLYIKTKRFKVMLQPLFQNL